MMVKSSTYTGIVIIEPHGILREGLRALIELEVDLRVVGEASTGADGVRVVQSSEPVSARLVSGYLRRNEPTLGAAAGVYPRITEREREVLTHVALGESNKRVALALRLSVKTVEKHRANLMRKLELHNTASVTLFAVRNGLVPAQYGDQPPGDPPPMVATAVRP